ncbi:MAG TPA: thiamine pyrophosphate-binding protein [Woeseiaceae bacterium]|nr:thiamine pyrophosphate-binding protein [Woeseiaceae bacterium]
MTELTGADAIVQSLLGHGVDTVFGIPGYQTYELFDALARAGTQITVYTNRHEQGAGYMAFGYARSTGKVGVFSVVPGPGVLNAASAICTAQSTATPVLCIVGQIPSFSIGKHWGMLHELRDQAGTLRTLAKEVLTIEQPEDAPALVAEAMAVATGGVPGVVVLEMAMDVMAQRATFAVHPAEHAAQPVADIVPNVQSIDAAVELLRNAAAPMIVAGTAALDAAPHIVELAEQIGAPVVTTQNAIGLIDARHPLAFNLPQGFDYWPSVDLLVGIGSRLEYPGLHWGGWAGKKLIRIDADPDALQRPRTADAALHGTPSLIVERLKQNLEKHPISPVSMTSFAERKAKAAQSYANIQPQMDYLAAIRAALPEDGFFVDELTRVGYASWYGFQGYRPRHFISSGYQGNLGYGYAAALGVKVANPEAAVVSIAGDGGFLFNVQELATAAKYGIGVVNIVFNNNAYGNVRSDQRRLFDGRSMGSDLKNPDFIELAKSFGIRAMRVAGPAALQSAIAAALETPGPCLIEVPIADTTSPWDPIFPRGPCAGLFDEAG